MRPKLIIILIPILFIGCRKDEDIKTEEPIFDVSSLIGSYTGIEEQHYENWYYFGEIGYAPHWSNWEYTSNEQTHVADGIVEQTGEGEIRIQAKKDYWPYAYFDHILNIDATLSFISEDFEVQFKGENNDSLILQMTILNEYTDENTISNTQQSSRSLTTTIYRLKRD